DESKGISWVKWESVLLEKNKDGLGIGSLKAKYLSLIGKCKWRFHVESEALWCKVVKAIHGPNGGFGVRSNSGLHKGVWANIVSNSNAIDKCDTPFSSSIIRKVGDGRDVMFCNDVWLECGVRLKGKYHRLFALETHQDCSIADCWKLQNGSWVGDWRWRSDLRGRSTDDLAELSNRLTTICLVDGSVDRWQWSLARNGHFFANHLSKLVDNNVLDQFALGRNHIWNNLVLIKVNVCICRAEKNKLPTYCSLASKGINIPSSRCPLCNNGDEKIDHIDVVLLRHQESTGGRWQSFLADLCINKYNSNKQTL
ncbi:RNA-directed DNA polymerase, eukaryota, reverse transcriptase zinc-binding domain protein, partial [Tanacetum coccineum]